MTIQTARRRVRDIIQSGIPNNHGTDRNELDELHDNLRFLLLQFGEQYVLSRAKFRKKSGGGLHLDYKLDTDTVQIAVFEQHLLLSLRDMRKILRHTAR